jgi:hypothetical protein
MRSVPLGKRPRYSLQRRLSEPQSWSGSCGEEKNVPPAGIRTLAVQPVGRRYFDYATCCI